MDLFPVCFIFGFSYNVVVFSASISVVSEQRLIVIDSGSLIYYFKALDDDSLDKWLKTIRQSRLKYQQNMQSDIDETSDNLQSRIADLSNKLHEQITPKLKIAELELDKSRDGKEITGRPRTLSSSSMTDPSSIRKKLALLKGKSTHQSSLVKTSFCSPDKWKR